MTETSATRGVPRWRVICDQLRQELGGYRYGAEYHTINDVCRLFDVSKITAIRVLTELSNEGLIEKIPGKGNVVRQLGQRSKVCVVTPVTASREFFSLDPVVRRLLEGVTDAARKLNVECNYVSERQVQRLFPRPDGTVGFLGLRRLSSLSLKFLRHHQLHHVLIDPLDRFDRASSVRLDRVKAGYLATRHLLDLGHRRIAWITGLIQQRNFRQRMVGSRQAAREKGLPFNWSMVRESLDMDTESTYAAMESLWESVRPTAIVCGSDERALDVLDFCRRRGIDVPGDLSVVSFPNNPEASLSNPPLTAMDGMYEKIGQESLKLLLERMTKPFDIPLQSLLVEPTLVERRSCSTPRPTRRAATKSAKKKSNPSMSSGRARTGLQSASAQ